ncbi:MAG: hypothetical protein ABL959_05865 [Pyrinomonadaceae bacterium]
MNKLTDKQLDNVMAMLASESSIDIDSAKEIAESPQLWWSVQRNIAVERSASGFPWPPPKLLFRWFVIGLPAIAVAVFAVTYFDGVGGTIETERTGSVAPQGAASPAAIVNVPDANEPSIDIAGIGSFEPAQKALRYETGARRAKHGSRVLSSRNHKPRDPRPQVADEIRTDFIALTYSRRPESGHLVRVKVPSSMMVNLGLVDSVEKPSSMVNAEVVVGDDGQTHAIRFIRQ